MNVPMSKALLFCLDTDREQTLEVLRGLGVLHVTAAQPPTEPALEPVRQRLARVRRVLDALPESAAAGGSPAGDSADALLDKADALLQQRKAAADALERIRAELRRLEPLGDFSPEALAKLDKAGIPVTLYQAPLKTPLAAPEGTILNVVGRDRHAVCFAVVGPHEPDPRWERFRLPERAPAEWRAEAAAREADLAAADSGLRALAAARPALAALETRTRESLEFLEVREGMGQARRVAFLKGFCPTESVPALRKAAAAHGWGLFISEPDESEPVPTLIRNPAWVRPIRAVFQFIGLLNGYGEPDISAVFMLFFTLFVAMLIGDAGYGAIILILAFLGRRKMASSPSTLRLFYTLGAATLGWGLLTANYFGMDLSSRLPSVSYLTDAAKKDDNVKYLCFLIGAVHLTIAHVWTGLRVLRSWQVLAEIGRILVVWSMFFLAKLLVLNQTIPTQAVAVMFGVGLVLIVLFMTPVKKFKTEWYNHVMLPLTIIGNFVDVVSYIRLFAVGFAGVAVADSFNKMALGMGAGNLAGGIAAVLVLLVGHGLNLALSAMAVIVHGVRLNTLEFSQHMGMQWTGVRYSPFARLAESEPGAGETGQ
jgi:V/A-type H+-transporting ATPase subunit I